MVFIFLFQIFSLLPALNEFPYEVEDPSHCLTVRQRRSTWPHRGHGEINDASEFFKVNHMQPFLYYHCWQHICCANAIKDNEEQITQLVLQYWPGFAVIFLYAAGSSRVWAWRWQQMCSSGCQIVWTSGENNTMTTITMTFMMVRHVSLSLSNKAYWLFT